VQNNAPLLADLMVTAHRLIRIAAQSTGSTTPSAVWNTLSILSTDGPLRIGELAFAARVTQPSMTKVVHQLVDEKLVRRVTDADDSRAWLVSATAAGIQALEDWRITLATTLEPLFSDLDPAELEALTRAVEILAARTATGRMAA
jgi:DNA-binding MarR family transcriptional regulator